MRHTLLIAFALLVSGCPDQSDELTIASFNAWGAGANRGESIEATVAVLRALDADVIALQEVRAEGHRCDVIDCPPAEASVASALADAIGYYVFEQPPSNDALWANAILSRYPVSARIANDLGVILDVNGAAVAILNVHLTDYPYQPYQLTGIEYGEAPLLHDADAAAQAAEAARGEWVDLVLETAAGLGGVRLVAICGDFNEPSHLDWTARAANIGRHPMAVAFPASRKLEAAGFVDGYRRNRPDEVRDPGFTWTPFASRDDPDEHHDRIDFVYLRGDDVRIRSANVAGETAMSADIVVPDWPSDHRAVVVTASF